MGNRSESNSTLSLSLFDRVLDRDNLIRALKQVQRNKGAAGVDGIKVNQLDAFLKTHWLTIKAKLLTGQYAPKPVLRVDIPKGDGTYRPLGIPTVLDRVIQQAIAQVLQEEWEPKFHRHSYGFRPNRNAHHAVHQARDYLRQGFDVVVDCDLKSFFDTVNHDKLMWLLKRHYSDKQLLQLINRYLKAGVVIDGSQHATTEGVPQGGPLSPVLANILLTELDNELDRRNLRFVRYADDFMIFVKSDVAGQRVLENLTCFLSDSLRLKVNTHKSGVKRPWEVNFLGFTFTRKRGFKIKVSEKSERKLKAKVKEVSRRTRGQKVAQVILELRITLLGWKAYFGINEVTSRLRDLDKWIRRRLRSYIWKQWGRSGYRNLRRLGIDRWLAWNTAKSAHGPWRLSASPALYRALPNRYFKNLGLPSLID